MTTRQQWFSSNRMRHPLGNGKPGPHNWSGTDEHTATQEPLGGVPGLVPWSVAIVLTSGGWVGRVDFHTPKSQIFHCAVEPSKPNPEVMEKAKVLVTPELMEYVNQLLREYLSSRTSPNSRFYSYYENETLDRRFPAQVVSMFCAECCVELEPYDTDYLFNTDFQVDILICPNCGQAYYNVTSEIPPVRGTTELRERPASRKRKSAPWQGSFWKTWRK